MHHAWALVVGLASILSARPPRSVASSPGGACARVRIAAAPRASARASDAYGPSGGSQGAMASAIMSAQDSGMLFAELLRDAAPYIAMHRASQVVMHLPGELIERPADFAAIMDDLALLNLLGVRIVVVVGVRAQIDARLTQLGITPRFAGATRITDAATMRIVKEAAGYARSEVESALARGLTRISWRGAPGAANDGSGGFNQPLPAPTPPDPDSEPADGAAPLPGPPAAALRERPMELLSIDDPAFAHVRSGRVRSSRPHAAPSPASGSAAAPAAAAAAAASSGASSSAAAEAGYFSPRPLRGVEVVSSNTLFTARPIGVRNGIDFGYSGEVRKVNRDSITELLARDWVVLLTPLGYSASGEVYNCNSHELACETAAQLGASKLIFFTPERWTLRPGDDVESAASAPRVQAMRMQEADGLVERFRRWQREATARAVWRARSEHRRSSAAAAASEPAPAAPAGAGPSAPDEPPPSSLPERAPPPAAADKDRLDLVDGGGRLLQLLAHEPGAAAAAGAAAPPRAATREARAHFVQLCSWSVRALSRSVRRAHLIDPAGGEVLEELYTSAGTGMLIARDVYEGFRAASAGDIPKIMELIEPLEAQGILTRRGREVIEADVERGVFHVLERDGQVLACAILKLIPAAPAAAGGAEGEPGAPAAADAPASDGAWAEVGCLAVNNKYRNGGRGEAMLGYLQRLALSQGVTHLFCLSTHTMQWFQERGFKQVPVSVLPASRVQAYNWRRNSKCFVKNLSSSRDLDAQELFWGA